MHPKDADSIANSEDPDQTVPLGAVWSGSALFAQTNLFENNYQFIITIIKQNHNKYSSSVQIILYKDRLSYSMFYHVTFMCMRNCNL